MKRESIARHRQLFLAALEVPKDQRSAFLRTHCDDDELRRGVEELLALDDEVAAEGRGSAPPGGAPPRSNEHGGTVHGSSIGDFTLIEELGRGGIGVVWLAEQRTLGRRVALKLLRPGLESEELLQRFRQEAAILGRLQHPGIAHVYDIGTTTAGEAPFRVEQPYIAMEYVRGVSLARYAEDQQLDIQGRLRLIAQVCDAVDYAHRKGVIHRDLKPDNILVCETGRVVVLDFGIARVTESDLMTASLNTMPGQIMGTLPYMSPEQVAGRVDLIDAQSDVYSLGVVMFELLSGQVPIDVQGRSIAVAADWIRSKEPTPLRSINALIRKDVETIQQVALEKQRSRRYASAAELAADIRRYLADEPILARPTTSAYRFVKFARRHRGVVAGAAATFVSLVTGTAIAIFFAIRADRNAVHAQRAERSLDRSTSSLVVANLLDTAATTASLYEVAANARRQDWIHAATEVRGRIDALELDPEDEVQREARALLPTLERHRRAFEDYHAKWALFKNAIAASGRADLTSLGSEMDDTLLPLGVDAQSGCWEFLAGGTGSIPAWEGPLTSGRAVIGTDHGVILVLLPENFLIAKTELTRNQWQRLIGGRTVAAGDLPQSNITYFDCIEWLAPRGLSMPTSKQWHYAARAGATTRYWAGDAESDLARIGWYRKNSGRRVHRIAELPANAFGLHDVHGNLWEWLQGDDAPAQRFVGGGSLSEAEDTEFERYNNLNLSSLASNHVGVRPVRSAWVHPDIDAATVDGRLFVIQDDRLYAVGDDGTRTRLGHQCSWRGSIAMTALGASLFVIQDDRLHSVDPSDGSYKVLGERRWTGTAAIAAWGTMLFVVQHDDLLVVNPQDGSYRRIGSAGAWPATSTMTCLQDQLCIACDTGLNLVDPSTGLGTRIETERFKGVTTLVAREGQLYTMENRSLYSIDPSTGKETRLGEEGPWSPGAALAVLGKRLVVTSRRSVFEVALASGNFTRLGGGVR